MELHGNRLPLDTATVSTCFNMIQHVPTWLTHVGPTSYLYVAWYFMVLKNRYDHRILLSHPLGFYHSPCRRLCIKVQVGRLGSSGIHASAAASGLALHEIFPPGIEGLGDLAESQVLRKPSFRI